jgi:hypothetical protein
MTRLRFAFVALAGVALAAVGCNADPPSPATAVSRGQSKAAVVPPRDDRTRETGRGTAVAQKGDGFVVIGNSDEPKAVTPEVHQGKAKAPAKAVRVGKPAEPPSPPAEEPTFTVAGGFESTKEKAKESAVRAAVEKLHDYLVQQDPPVSRMPTVELVQRMLVRHPDPAPWDASVGHVVEQPIEVGGKTETMYQVEVAVKVKPEHVRALRSRDRASEALWVLAGLGGLAGVFAVFFRIDAWTKGYLTSWLVLGTVGAAALLGGLWWFARS